MKNYGKNNYEDMYLNRYGYGKERYCTPSLPQDLNATIELNPHYSNPKFDRKGAVEIWGDKESGIEYVYSDRLVQWDSTKANEAAKKTNGKGIKPKTARWVQTYLSFYFDKPVKVCHIYAGVKPNGYSYWAAGYKFEEQKS